MCVALQSASCTTRGCCFTYKRRVRSLGMVELAASDDGVGCPSEVSEHGPGHPDIDLPEHRSCSTCHRDRNRTPPRIDVDGNAAGHRRWAHAAPVLCTNLVCMAALSVLNLVSCSHSGLCMAASLTVRILHLHQPSLFLFFFDSRCGHPLPFSVLRLNHQRHPPGRRSSRILRRILA